MVVTRGLILLCITTNLACRRAGETKQIYEGGADQFTSPSCEVDLLDDSSTEDASSLSLLQDKLHVSMVKSIPDGDAKQPQVSLSQAVEHPKDSKMVKPKPRRLVQKAETVHGDLGKDAGAKSSVEDASRKHAKSNDQEKLSAQAMALDGKSLYTPGMDRAADFAALFKEAAHKYSSGDMQGVASFLNQLTAPSPIALPLPGLGAPAISDMTGFPNMLSVWQQFQGMPEWQSLAQPLKAAPGMPGTAGALNRVPGMPDMPSLPGMFMANLWNKQQGMQPGVPGMIDFFKKQQGMQPAGMADFWKKFMPPAASLLQDTQNFTATGKRVSEKKFMAEVHKERDTRVKPSQIFTATGTPVSDKKFMAEVHKKREAPVKLVRNITAAGKRVPERKIMAEVHKERDAAVKPGRNFSGTGTHDRSSAPAHAVRKPWQGVPKEKFMAEVRKEQDVAGKPHQNVTATGEQAMSSSLAHVTRKPGSAEETFVAEVHEERDIPGKPGRSVLAKEKHNIIMGSLPGPVV